jgi:hypothetical protein
MSTMTDTLAALADEVGAHHTASAVRGNVRRLERSYVRDVPGERTSGGYPLVIHLAGRDDVSPAHPRSQYDPRCSCCWLGSNHSVDKHRASIEHTASAVRGCPAGVVKVDGRYFPRMLPDARAKRTDQLEPGDRLLVDGRYVRTVAEVRPTGYVNHRGETILAVVYAEGDTSEWSGANSGAPGTMWKVEVAA